MQVTKIIQVKRGDSFRLECAWTDPAGAARSLVDVSVASWLKRGPSIIVLTYEAISAADGTFALSIPQVDIDNLTEGSWICDVEFTVNGRVESTETFSVYVFQDVTNAA